MNQVFIFLINFFIYILFVTNIVFSLEISKNKKTKAHSTTELPLHILAFPINTNNYLKKILENSGSYEIWNLKKISSWTQSQGFLITQDSPLNNLQFNRGIIFKPPGLFFELNIEAHINSPEDRLGWILNLDMGFFKEDRNKEIISTNFKNYENLICYEIFINEIHFRTIEIGYGKTHISPIKLRIPFIRNREGKIIVKIKMTNRPDNFGILYDASLTKEVM